MLRLSSPFLVTASLAVVMFAGWDIGAQKQTSPTLEEAEYAHHVWRTRAFDLTGAIKGDTDSMIAGERAMYAAYLAKVWWKVDKKEAEGHLQNSARIIISLFDSINEKNIGSHLPYLKTAMSTILSLDEKLALDLIRKMDSSDSDEDRRPDPKMAELLVEMGREIVDANPELALTTGMDSIRYGLAMELPYLIADLQAINPLYAEILMNEGLRAARGRHAADSHLFLFNMARLSTGIDGSQPFPIAPQRVALRAFADMLASAMSIEHERSARCGIAFYAPRLRPAIDTLFPELSLSFRQSLASCIPYTNPTEQEQIANRSKDEPQTIDELFKAARETKDLYAKITLYREAFGRLEREGKFAEMVSILDGFDGDDFKKAAPIGWDNWRIGAATDGSFAAFKTGDLPSTYRFIDRTPKRLRPMVRHMLIQKDKVKNDREFLLDNLKEMEKELIGIDQPEHEVAGIYLRMSEVYLWLTPTESVSSFRTAVKFIDAADRKNPDQTIEKDWAPMSDYVKVSSDLLVLDEIGVNAALNGLGLAKSKVRLRLGLLESTLPRYAEARDIYIKLRKEKPDAG